MARRPKTVGIESSADLAKKAEILEREMATQRDALERLRKMGVTHDPDTEREAPPRPERRRA